MSRADFIQLHPRDSVVVCLRDFSAGEHISLNNQVSIEVREAIRAGHKVAIREIEAEQAVFKFGWPIGTAQRKVLAGEHVHTHNVICSHQVDRNAIASQIPEPLPPQEYHFDGFRRPDGRAGTRNYVAVISNVNCSASVARMIAQRCSRDLARDFPGVDGVISFRHEGGCAMGWEGSRHRMLNQVLGGMARHANIGAFLLVGLGCEQATLGHLISSQQLHSIQVPPIVGLRSNEQASAPEGANPLPVLSIQDLGGTAETVARGCELVAKLLPQVNAQTRTQVSAEHLVLGLECGGSDGYSGITANPALGVAADLIVACGGTVVLSETPEIVGAEHLLTARARSRRVAEKLLERIEWWEWYCRNYGEQLDNNPSMGNKAGGLTTITEKSLGAVTKGGSSALEAVYEYAEPIRQSGFVFMDTPGFDPASVTGMVAGGANLVAFTTGRGSCFGFKPAPSFKIASNSQLYQRLRGDMDFNAGQVLEGMSVDEVGQQLFQDLLATASGRPTCSEALGIGDEEFVPWQVGPVL
jgi:altronate hydrolase